MTISFTHKNSVQFDHDFTTTPIESNTILLLGNDHRLSNSFQYQLYNHGYKVIQKDRDENILSSIAINKPFLVMLDIGFSHLAVLNIISKIRAIFSGPLIILTSRDSEKEQVTAFNLGADEYLVKPVSENILNVRVDSLFRRYNRKILADENSKLHLGELTLFPNTFKCQFGGKEIMLTQFEFKLLRLLVENIGKIMSRDFIYQSLLGREYNGSERTVDVRVSQLREKLAKNRNSKIKIETVWGQGYTLTHNN